MESRGIDLVNDEIKKVHWIASISGNNTFKVSQHALDTGPRVLPGADFTAVIIGFKSNSK
jgi:hypothetical protein